MRYQNLNELYENSPYDIVFLTNSLGESADNVSIPEAIYEWYEDLDANSATLLYLVKLKGQYGIMAINEFDEESVRNLFDSSYVEMRKTIQMNANSLCRDELVGQYDVFVGEETGFGKCDEIAVFIPFGTLKNSPSKETINKILKVLDASVYEKSIDY